MHRLSPLTDSIVSKPIRRVNIIGGGQVAKSILIVSSLRNLLNFRIIVRSVRSAELIRAFANDLPLLDIEIVVSDVVPDLRDEVVILALGARTGRSSRRSTKEQLYTKNIDVVRALLPSIVQSRVIVITNPSTLLTRFLVANGVEAYGVGVANDQARFSKQHEMHQRLHLVGGHNFYDLVIGSWYNPYATDRDFSHGDYRQLVHSQDALKTRAVLSDTYVPQLDYRWEQLASLNAAFPSEYRWYARQRIHSKYHSTAISCALAAMNMVSLLSGELTGQDHITVELPLHLPGVSEDSIIGWPISTASRTPIEMTFDDRSMDKLKSVARSYSVLEGSTSLATPCQFELLTPFGARVGIHWTAKEAYTFFDTHLRFLASISRMRGKPKPLVANVVLQSDDTFFRTFAADTGESLWEKLPQHRGSNPQEHTDLSIFQRAGQRAIRFPSADAVAVVTEKTRQVDLFCKDQAVTFHELRRLIRDEILIPMMVSGGAHIFHAGLVRCAHLTVLILGTSGSGKTTSVLSLLSHDRTSQYGSAERTALWLEGRSLVALGVPESVTIFPGTLKGFAQFADLAPTTETDLWSRQHKMRLQQSDIVARTATSIINGPTRIDLIIEVAYDPTLPSDGMGYAIDRKDLQTVFRRHDLTSKDTVRCEWLGWFAKVPDDEFYNKQELSTNTRQASYVTWSNTQSLKEAILGIIAREHLARK